MSRSRLAVFASVLTLVGGVVGLFAVPALAKPAMTSKTVKITVVAKEFSFTLSKSSVKHGTTVIFTVINRGAIAHDFKLVGYKKTALLQPGQKVTLTVKFPKKARVSYLCTLPRHASQGMAGTFVVT